VIELQKKLLELLCEIDEICKKHDISYCLFAGTALGADRHKGFIPWDDDADIIMTLENYEKFLKVAPAELKDNRALNSLEGDVEKYPFTYARYVDIGTSAIQRHTAFGDCDPGIKIDIFYVVPTYSDEIKANKHRLEILAFSETVCPNAIMHLHRPDGFYKAYDKELKRCKRQGRKKYVEKRLKKLKNHGMKCPEKYVLLSGMMCNSYIMDAKIMDNIEYVPFENTELPISIYNKEFNELLYGAGWINKPLNVEKPRHSMLLDFNEPYQSYIDKLWETLDYDEMKALIRKRKTAYHEERRAFKETIRNNQKIRNLVVEMSVTNAYENAIAEGITDYVSIAGIFQKYYKTQLSAVNRFHGIIVELKPEIWVKAIYAAIATDCACEARDIIKLCENANDMYIKETEINQLKYLSDMCIDLMNKMYVDESVQEVKNVLAQITDASVKEFFVVKNAEFWIKCHESKNEEDLKNLCNEIDAYLKRVGCVGEIMAIKGECQEKLHLLDEAGHSYEIAYRTVKNGMIFHKLSCKGIGGYEK